MRRRHRSPLSVALLLSLLAALDGCSHKQTELSVEQQQRELLTPVNAEKAQAALDERLRLYDASGQLLPSDQIVAGIALPRGLSLFSKTEYVSTFQSDRVPVRAFDRYFTAHLAPKTIERGPTGAVLFDLVRPPDKPNAAPFTVRVAPLLGSLTASEVEIHEAEPAKPIFTQAQVEAEMRERAKYAH